MIDSNPSPLMTQMVANTAIPNYGNYAQPATRLTIEQMQNQYQQYHNPQQIQSQTQSDPYTDYINTLASCSELVRQKIMQDKNYQIADNECEMLVKQLWYSEIIPKVMNYQQGRIAFEKLYNITKQLKQEYMQEEVQMTQNMQVLMQDEVVLARLRELQNQQNSIQQTQTKKQTKTQAVKSVVEESGGVE